MRLSIIIVSYNTRDLTFRCLQSIYRIKNNLDLEIIVVDNASTDQSGAFIAQTFPEVKIIKNSQNVGFGPANNQAAKIALGDYLLFLNSDTEVIGDNLEVLLKAVEQNQSPLASCRLVNRDNSLQPQGGALPNLFNLSAWMLLIDDLPGLKRFFPAYQRRSEGYFLKDQHPGWLAGTALIVKKDVFERLGGFNPDIFMYGEDIDLCYRARIQGYRRDYFTSPQILHLGQGSGNHQSAVLGELKFLTYFFKRYKPAWQGVVFQALKKIGCLLRIWIFGMIGQYERKKIYQQIYHLV